MHSVHGSLAGQPRRHRGSLLSARSVGMTRKAPARTHTHTAREPSPRWRGLHALHRVLHQLCPSDPRARCTGGNEKRREKQRDTKLSRSTFQTVCSAASARLTPLSRRGHLRRLRLLGRAQALAQASPDARGGEGLGGELRGVTV